MASSDLARWQRLRRRLSEEGMFRQIEPKVNLKVLEVLIVPQIPCRRSHCCRILNQGIGFRYVCWLPGISG